tara:strand:+ start:1154 stop:1564 length:411 start_codon:yes stop_codon:yes gene_type:complete
MAKAAAASGDEVDGGDVLRSSGSANRSTERLIDTQDRGVGERTGNSQQATSTRQSGARRRGSQSGKTSPPKTKESAEAKRKALRQSKSYSSAGCCSYYNYLTFVYCFPLLFLFSLVITHFLPRIVAHSEVAHDIVL